MAEDHLRPRVVQELRVAAVLAELVDGTHPVTSPRWTVASWVGRVLTKVADGRHPVCGVARGRLVWS
ncbi:hypothetical protein ABZ690_04565 [Streptomyces sp. NPDC006967]|uniref:hypothetical protein n=1 Tax=unclassified Streptomyces TaxID=2593676 RepID=UPI001CA57D88|nr:hypothetical protein [Streptomyces sp. SM1]